MAAQVALGTQTVPSPDEIAARAKSEAVAITPDAPLDPSPFVRSFGRRLGYDFSGVRLRSDPDAGRTVEREGAHAITDRDQILFAPGRLRPDLPVGRALIAHELAHVAQVGAAARGNFEPADLALHDELHEGIDWEAEGWAGGRLLSCNGNGTPSGSSSKSEGGAASGDAGPGDAGTPAKDADAGTKTPDAGSPTAPVTPPTGDDVATVVSAANTRAAELSKLWKITGPTALDPDWVRAMMEVEAPPSMPGAHKYDPMQIGNKGDPGLATLQKGGERSDILDPGIKAIVAKKTPTPHSSKVKTDRGWDYASVPAASRMDRKTSIRAGVTWLFVKAAKWPKDQVSVETGTTDKTTKVEKGEGYGMIVARLAKAGIRTTVKSMETRTGKASKALRPGDTVTFREARMEWQATGWDSWDDATEAYNGGGDPDYLKKVKDAYAKIKAGTSTPTPAPKP